MVADTFVLLPAFTTNEEVDVDVFEKELVTVSAAVPVLDEPEPAMVNPAEPFMLTSLVTAIEALLALAPVTSAKSPLDTLRLRPTLRASAVVEVNPNVNPFVPEIFKSRPTVVNAALKFLDAEIGELNVKSEND